MARSRGVLDIDLAIQRGDFHLHVQEQLPLNGVTAVFGHSGSGKTTLLRCIAGFDVGEGAISCGDQRWFDSRDKLQVPPYKRGVGYMFQQPGLFPHLNVEQNLRYAERRAESALRATLSDTESELTFEQVVGAFHLNGFLSRSTSELSGGEAQRVALARTLLTQPRLLLLDEPLAALDDKHKAELLPYLETLVQNFRLPVLYVSHDVDEVARLADRMLVLEAGRVVALGSTQSLFERLDIADVSGRFESGALLDAQVVAQDESWMLTRLTVAGQPMSIPARPQLGVGDSVRLSIRARDVALALQKPSGLSIRNAFAGVVHDLRVDLETPFAEVTVELEPGSPHQPAVRLRSRITRAAAAELDLKPGLPVFALVKTVMLDR